MPLPLYLQEAQKQEADQFAQGMEDLRMSNEVARAVRHARDKGEPYLDASAEHPFGVMFDDANWQSFYTWCMSADLTQVDVLAARRFRREQGEVGGTPVLRPKSRKLQPKRGEDIFAGTDYPRHWEGFIGQEEVKEQLMVQVASARARGKRLDHTLLATGQHGAGKTTLAHLVAYKAEAGVHQVSGVVDTDKFRTLLKTMRDGDVVIWDEFHTAISAGKSKAEWLLPFMTEGKLYTPEGVIECPDVTIIGATTDAGRLPETILSRFMVKPRFVSYAAAEGAEIAGNLAARMDVEVDKALWPRIAAAANLNPRDMRSILTAIRDLRLAFPNREVDLAKAFRWAGFSADGLTQQARDVLLILRHAKDNTAAIDTIQGMLSEPGPLRHAEKDLLGRGFIEITGRGRKLTDAGLDRADRLVREEVAA